MVAGAARPFVYRRRAARSGRGSLGWPRENAPEKPQQIVPHRRKIRAAGLWLQMDDQVQGWEMRSVLPSPVDLSDPPLEPLADHRAADLAAGGDPEAWMPDLVRNEIEDRQRSMPPAARPITSEIVRPPPQPLLRWQALARPARRVRHQTLRRLRPFARRREMTARPLRVRIRTRKP